MLRFGEKEIAIKSFYASKKPIRFWDVNADNIVVTKLVKTKTNSKYLIWIKFDKAIRPLVLIMHNGLRLKIFLKTCAKYFTSLW